MSCKTTYLVVFEFAASLAATPLGWCESAMISGMVTSRAVGLSLDHSSSSAPSGLVLVLVVKQKGFVEGT